MCLNCQLPNCIKSAIQIVANPLLLLGFVL